MEAKQVAKWEQTTGHCLYGPSQLPRIVACPASVKETLKAPIRDAGEAAKEGTRKHRIMEIILLEMVDDAGNLKVDYQELPEYQNLSADDKPGIQSCLDFFIQCYKNILDMAPTNDILILIEGSSSLAHHGIREIYGTADVILCADGILHVIDWKFGGTPVFLDTNYQMITYTLGAGQWSQSYFKKDPTLVQMSIGQPVLDSFITETVSYEDLKQHLVTLRTAVADAKSPVPTYNPNEQKQCRFCPGKATCLARKNYGKQLARDAFSMVDDMKAHDAFEKPREVSTVKVAEWVELLYTLKEIETMASDIRKFFHRRLQQGLPVPGKKLVHGRTTRKWRNPDGVVKFLKDQLGMDNKQIYKKLELQSPAGIEKINKSLKKDPDFQMLIDKKPGAPQVVDEDDPREAVSTASVFEGV